MDGKADEPGQVLNGNLNQLRELKQKYPKLRISISLGGWTGSAHFSDAALTPASRAAHVKSCIDLWLKGNLPGLPAGAAKGTIEERLKRLQTLSEQGLITADEYARRKAEILKEL